MPAAAGARSSRSMLSTIAGSRWERPWLAAIRGSLRRSETADVIRSGRSVSRTGGGESRRVPGGAVNLLLTAVIVAGTVVVTVGVFLLVRQRAPEGGYFSDGDRAAGVFGVLATGFAVLLGFIVFLAFTSYDAARAGAESEARIVAQQVETAQLMPPAVAPILTGELVCYARSVAGVQWQRMEDGTLGEELNPWGAALAKTLLTADPQTPAQQAAYGKWLDETSDREEARQDRI